MILNSNLGAGGWVPTERNTLLREGSSNVFVVGDTTNIPISKAGSTAHFEADTIVDNLASLIKEDRWARSYDGKVFCFVETGMNTGTYVWFDYTDSAQSGTPLADGSLVQAGLQPAVLALCARLAVRRYDHE